jgi:phenylalanine ammonia-lyase
MTVTLESLARYTPVPNKAPVNGFTNRNSVSSAAASSSKPTNLKQNFIDSYKEIHSYRYEHPCPSLITCSDPRCRNGSSVVIDGHNLSIPAVTATARFNASVSLEKSANTQHRLQKSRAVIVQKMALGKSVYGVSTGYGGSGEFISVSPRCCLLNYEPADTRSDDPLRLGSALLQHQHTGVISTTGSESGVLPLMDPLASTSMPESWVRGAMVIRMNSLIRGHSGVRLELIEQMADLLRNEITPLVPLRGSISASGDLSPLSYIAGALIGNPSIRTICKSPSSGVKRIVPSNQALAQHNLEPLSLQSKEHLGILNGTAFSASVAALALNDSVHLALLAQILTAMGVEALLGTQASFDSFIHAECRPHPGQIEVASTVFGLLEGSAFATGCHTEEEEANISEDKGQLRQDRYPLRTSPQFLGPQVEDILSALAAVTLECNSSEFYLSCIE